MEDIKSFENYAVNNIIFLNFLKLSNDILNNIPSIDQVYIEFPIKNKDNVNRYLSEFNSLLVHVSNQNYNKKRNLILDWAKQNDFPLPSKYDENHLSELIEKKLFPIYNQKINALYQNKNLLMKLLYSHIIHNLFNSIKFLLEIKNMYLKKKEALIEANKNYRKLFDLSIKSETELKQKIELLKTKISDYNNKIEKLSSENEKLKSLNEALSSANFKFTCEIQNNEVEIINLKSQINSLTQKIEDIQRENKSTIDAVKSEYKSKIEATQRESRANYVALASLMNEILDKISSDVTKKIVDIKDEMKEKLNKIIQKE